MKTKYNKTKRKEEFKVPSPKKVFKTAVYLGAAGLTLSVASNLLKDIK